jgi:hypothetical protein
MPQELLEKVPEVIKLSSYSKHGHDRLLYYEVDEFWEVKGSVIEIEESGGDVLKVLIRKQYSKKLDLVIAIGFTDCYMIGFVKTLWLAKKGSSSRNLNRARYVTKEGSNFNG